ncbi:hypothetical protein RGQ15_10120 [Paracoccus sp. MBLB3053]|uniref:Uncharacterized protein n=1 Tax=Paracoccus aurantius TaxID=3073814 RepID=A0ABU2HS94_9RHOB|nr:hypothetical protein [Paracoccus sp. MBLB3053]MDS9467921.1 hypothetical protein [Paracoccus sp. MBLB3053]
MWVSQIVHAHDGIVELEEQRSAQLRGLDGNPADLSEPTILLACKRGCSPTGDLHFADPYERELARLLKLASEDKLSFDILNHHATFLLGKGAPLPVQLRLFLMGVLTGRLSSPSISGRPKIPSLRDEYIHDLVGEVAQKFHLKPTRNDSPGANAFSASDAVAQAMVQLRRRPQSYDVIRKIWLRGPYPESGLGIGELDLL